jgi:hypothetical protein
VFGTKTYPKNERIKRADKCIAHTDYHFCLARWKKTINSL